MVQKGVVWFHRTHFCTEPCSATRRAHTKSCVIAELYEYTRIVVQPIAGLQCSQWSNLWRCQTLTCIQPCIYEYMEAHPNKFVQQHCMYVQLQLHAHRIDCCRSTRIYCLLHETTKLSVHETDLPGTNETVPRTNAATTTTNLLLRTFFSQASLCFCRTMCVKLCQHTNSLSTFNLPPQHSMASCPNTN